MITFIHYFEGSIHNRKRYAVSTDSTKQWMEKMKTLLISKGLGFLSCRILTFPRLYWNKHTNILKKIILEQTRCSKTQFVEMKVENNLKRVNTEYE
jgi:hypothetical protein